jgi:hypothetical protein
MIRNVWHKARFEATGQSCEVVAVYFAGKDGPRLLRLLLADGRALERVAKGQYLTLWNQVVISTEPDAP